MSFQGLSEDADGDGLGSETTSKRVGCDVSR